MAYMRVSSEEQAKAGYSIPHQRQRIVEYASRNDFEIVESFEEAHSARNPGRPEFERMLAALKSLPDVRVVLVHKQDRIARNLTDWAYLKERLRVHVLPVEEPVENTPMGQLTQTFWAGYAKFYSDNLSQEVRKGLRAKFEAGGFNTRAPVGYRNIPRSRTEKSRIELDPVTAPIVRHAFERYATGRVSLGALANEAFDMGLKTARGLALSKEHMSKMLRHPFYRGATVFHGDERPGLHEPLVPEALWYEVQRVLVARHKDHGEKGTRFFLLRGLLFCATCGHRWTAEAHARGAYYRCMPDSRRTRCREPYVPVGDLDARIEREVLSLRPPPALRARLTKALRLMREEREALRAREEQHLRTQIGALDAKLVRLTDGFATGVVAEEQYRVLRAGYQAELGTARDRLVYVTADLGPEIDQLMVLLDKATGLADLYRAAVTAQDRKALLNTVYSRILIQSREVVRMEYKPPFDLFFGDAPKRCSEDDIGRMMGQLGKPGDVPAAA